MRLVTALLVLVVSVHAFADDKPTPKLPLGKDTTVVDGPLDKDGYVDYAAVFQERFGKGVTPDNNIVAGLYAAVGPREITEEFADVYFPKLGIKPLPKKGDFFADTDDFFTTNREFDRVDPVLFLDQLERSTRRPWSEVEFPRVAEWLRMNEKPLAVAVEAVNRPRYYDPPVRMNGLILGGLREQELRDISPALAARALLRTHEKKYDAAVGDLLACHRLARHVNRGLHIFYVVTGRDFHRIACRATLAFLAANDPPAQQTLDLLGQLRKLPPLPELAEKYDVGQRFYYLDDVRLLRKGKPVWRASIDSPKTVKESVLSAVDWAPALKSGNAWFDKATAAAKLTNPAERRSRFEELDRTKRRRPFRFLPKYEDVLHELERVLESPRATAAEKKKAGEKAGSTIAELMFADLSTDFFLTNYYDEIEQLFHNLELAFALHAFKKDAGKYPPQLADLVPKYLSSIPDDLFSGKPLIYKPTDGGYLLYSVGPHGEDDGGRSYGDTPPGDDIVVRMPIPKR
jgi:hypothetical protein